MTTYDYAIAIGHDNTAGLQNIQTLIGTAPTTNSDQLVPLGSTQRKTLDQNVHTHGTKIIRWKFAAMSFEAFNTLIMTFLSFEIENADVTLYTRRRDETFGYYNAVMHLPTLGRDYQEDTAVNGSPAIRDLQLTFSIVSTFGGFSSGFSSGFNI